MGVGFALSGEASAPDFLRFACGGRIMSSGKYLSGSIRNIAAVLMLFAILLNEKASRV